MAQWSLLISSCGVAISAIAVVVTVVLWRSELQRRRRDEARGRRRALADEVLRLAERTSRYATFSLVSQVWFRPELEWALLLPRVYYELESTDRAVAAWVSIQVEAIQRSVRPVQTVRLATNVAYRIQSWDRGETPRSWFLQQAGDTLVAPAKTFLRFRLLKFGYGAWQWLKFDALIVAAALVVSRRARGWLLSK